jgi:threonine synthase
MGASYDLVIPTGNFGHVYAAWVAKQMGASIETITIANNSNHMVSDLVNTGQRTEAAVVSTLAPSMDIQVPSNLERFIGDPTSEFKASWSDDQQIETTISEVWASHGYRLDPHTATAWRAAEETRADYPQLVASTAHPAKFDDAVAPPDWFPSLNDLEERVITIDPDLAELEHQISQD